MSKLPEGDDQLIKKVQKGDKRAFDLLVLKYQGRVLALISNYIKDHGEMQDVAQETFIKVYRGIHNFRGDSAFYTWLYRIAVNTSKNYLFSLGRKVPSLSIDLESMQYSEDQALQHADSPESLLYKEQVEEMIFTAIDRLPDVLKEAIILREIEGLSYHEISKILAAPVGTVRSRIYRAREAINKVLRSLKN